MPLSRPRCGTFQFDVRMYICTLISVERQREAITVDIDVSMLMR
jgi:hypothetical protein